MPDRCPRCLSSGACLLGCGMADWDAPTYVNINRAKSRGFRRPPSKVARTFAPHDYSTRVKALETFSGNSHTW